MGIVGDIVTVVVAGFLGALGAQRLRLPLVLGYIVAGIIVGPYTAGPTVAEVRNIELLADIGVALLLFTTGLDFPLKRLSPVRRVALLGAPLQMLLTIALGSALARLFGWDWTEALWFGSLLSLSSTAVVIRTLAERGLLETLSGRVMVGILVVQDLAVVPLTVLLPELRDISHGLPQLGIAALRAAAIIAVMVVLGTRMLPWLLDVIARHNSRELFLIAVAAVGLGVGYATYLFGLSFAFGAFLAGVVLSESDYSHQALHDIAPLRDVFAMLFFVSVGMLIDPALAWSRAVAVAAVLVALVLGKGLILGGVTRLFGYGNIAPLAVGLSLFGVGEFAFVLARVGESSGAISPEVYAVVLTAAVITMALTPLSADLAPRAYRQWRSWFPSSPLRTMDLGSDALTGHVVIAGYGRVGRFVARFLDRSRQRFVVIELDHSAVQVAKKHGYPVIYGDAAAEPVLEAAGIREARLAVLTIPDAVGLRLAVTAIRRLNAALPIVSRAMTLDQVDELARLGVPEAVQPELQAGIELTHQALAHLGLDPGPLLRDAVRQTFETPPSQEP